MAATTTSTLYPKITQHVGQVADVLMKREHERSHPRDDIKSTAIPLRGTVKLHGTHADVLIYNDDKIVLQSRNVPNITLANDNLGFAAAMEDKSAALLSIRDKYLARWRALNPDALPDAQHPVLIAGEWIGSGVQKHVAVSKLSPRFVIISVAVNNAWVSDAMYPPIEAVDAGIYNVARGGTFTATLYLDDLARTRAEVERVADGVAAACPFAAVFGAEGEGEGVVWKPACAELNGDSALWFKTKGGRFKPTFAPKMKVLPVGVQEQKDAADKVAGIWCTEERLQQGWDYLGEVGVKRDARALGSYLKWVQSDILSEEKGYIEEYAMDKGMLRVGIAKVGRVWYIRRVGLGEE